MASTSETPEDKNKSGPARPTDDPVLLRATPTADLDANVYEGYEPDMGQQEQKRLIGDLHQGLQNEEETQDETFRAPEHAELDYTGLSLPSIRLDESSRLPSIDSALKSAEITLAGTPGHQVATHDRSEQDQNTSQALTRSHPTPTVEFPSHDAKPVYGLPPGVTILPWTASPEGSKLQPVTRPILSGISMPTPGKSAPVIPGEPSAGPPMPGKNGPAPDSGGLQPVGNGSGGSGPIVVRHQLIAPVVRVSNVSGAEDSPIALHIALDGGEWPSDASMRLRLTSPVAGWQLSAGIQEPDGSWTLTPDELVGLTLTPFSHWAGNLMLGVEVMLSHPSGETASAQGWGLVKVEAEADGAVIGWSPLTALEGATVPLGLTISELDTDSSEAHELHIAGLPAGATLSAGTLNPDGSYSVLPVDLAGLQIILPPDYKGAFGLAVTIISAEANGHLVTASAMVPVLIDPVADVPLLTVAPVAGTEDVPTPLPITASLVDASETLSVTIAGLPAGATLSAGTLNPDGSYTLTPAQLTGLTLVSALGYKGSVTLTVTATSTESDGSTSSVSQPLPVTIGGVADAPLLSVLAATGLEGSAIPLTISAALTDMAETLSITISGLPAGATLSAGTLNPDGSYTLTPAQLNGLSLIPDPDFKGSISLTVFADSTESNGDTASVSMSLPVTITAVADVPLLAVQPASGTEDQSVTLDIIATLGDPGETLEITIGNLPPGATLSAGILNPDGSYTLTPAQLAGLSLTPPADYHGSFSLSVTATSREGNGATASHTLALPVVIAGEADAPTLSVSAASGSEDTAIPLAIIAAVTDPAETFSINISGLPTGATLSAGVLNPDGSYTLTPLQLAGLTVTPPPNYAGVMTLVIEAISMESNGDTAATSAALAVTVASVADAPSLIVTSASAVEDAPIPLTIAASLTDSGETLSIIIDGLPAGATLSAGTLNPDGSYTLTPAQLIGLTLTPPANYDGSFTLIVTATSTDGGGTASTSVPLAVTISAEADAPNLSVSAATGVEDHAISLVITAGLTDAAETLSILIDGLPAGATLSAGTLNPDGSYTLSPAQLTGLTLTPPADYQGGFTLNVTAVSTASNGDTASTAGNLPVTISGEADVPMLTVGPASGAEGAPIALSIAATLADPSETLTIHVDGLPAGATLSAGTLNPDGSYTLTPAQLTGLTLLPPPDFKGTLSLTIIATSQDGTDSASATASLPITISPVADMPTLSVIDAAAVEDAVIPLSISAALSDPSETLSITVAGLPAGASLSAGTLNPDGSYTLTAAQLTGLTLTPPVNYHGSFALSVTATSSESGGGSITTPVAPLTITITSEADAPTLAASAAAGAEDSAVPLSITAGLTDPSESLSIRIDGIPTGATLSSGTLNPDGSYTLTPAQLIGLSLVPASGYKGSFSLSVTAFSADGAGHVASTTAPLAITVAGVADAPSLNVVAAGGPEDGTFPLSITAALIDPTETLSLTVTGLPAGSMLSAGTHNPDGSWSLTPAQLTGLTISPPPNFSGTLAFTVIATSQESNGSTASTSQPVSIAITSVADAPNLSVSAARGDEDTSIPLAITASLTDMSEVLSVNITGLPAGATLSAGTLNPDGSYTLTPAQMAGLTIRPPLDYKGSFNLTVVATSTEDNGTAATRTRTLPVTVDAAADTPAFASTPASGAEDTAIALHLLPSLSDTSGSEVLSILISGLPAGATLSRGRYAGNGAWAFSPAELAGLSITPPRDFSGVMNLQVTSIATEANGRYASTTSTYAVSVTPVADAPVITAASNLNALEDTVIALPVTLGLSDGDGSEHLGMVTISGVPTGATLSAGTNAGGGVWTLSPAQLTGLTLTPPANSNTDFTLIVTAQSIESNGTSANRSQSIAVNMTGVADAVTVVAANSTGAANTQIALSVTGTLMDGDGSETASYVISGMPDGFALNQGRNNGNNSWTLTSAQLTGLKLISPPTFEGQLNLYIKPVTRENDGDDHISPVTPFHVRVGNHATGHQVDLGVGVQVGGIGVGVNIPLGGPVDLFPSTGGLLTTGGFSVKEDTPRMIADAPDLLALPVLSAVLHLVSYISLSGIPAGTTFSAGTNLGGGVWSFSAAQLNNLTMTPPANSDSDFTIVATANMLFGLLPIPLASIPVRVHGAADQPTLTASAGAAVEDTAIPLTINAALVDTDGSETLSLLISGLPAGFQLNRGVDNGNGTWSLLPTDVTGLTLSPAANFSGAASFVVSAIATEREGDQAIRQQTVNFNVTPVCDGVTISTATITGNEDQSIPLNLNIGLKDNDGSETITAVTLSGLPAGATLIGATDNHNGTWSVDPTQLGGVSLVPAAHVSGDFTLGISVTTRETANGAQTTNNASLPLHIEAVADAPLATAGNVTGDADTPIPLSLSAALTDTDGSEVLSGVISGLPQGALLSAGTNNGDGSWTVTAAQLGSLNLIPPSGFDGDLSLSFTAYSVEANGSRAASASQSFTVHVDAPVMMMSMSMFSRAMPLDDEASRISGSWLDVVDGIDIGTQGAASVDGWLGATHEADADHAVRPVREQDLRDESLEDQLSGYIPDTGGHEDTFRDRNAMFG